MVYGVHAAVDCLSFNQISTSSFIRNSMQQKYKVAHTSHTTIHAKMKEFWEVAKDDTDYCSGSQETVRSLGSVCLDF